MHPSETNTGGAQSTSITPNLVNITDPIPFKYDRDQHLPAATPGSRGRVTKFTE